MNSALDDLEDFKEYMRETAKEYSRKKHSRDVYSNIIEPAIDDMLEDLEAYVENMAEDLIHEDALAYDTMEGE